MQTLNDILTSGELADYEHEAPSNDSYAIDSAVCRESACPGCGHIGLLYHPYTKGDSYRPFAVCPKCGYAEEF